jgi:hypothetical protein
MTNGEHNTRPVPVVVVPVVRWQAGSLHLRVDTTYPSTPVPRVTLHLLPHLAYALVRYGTYIHEEPHATPHSNGSEPWDGFKGKKTNLN